jgi:hypothetical protein
LVGYVFEVSRIGKAYRDVAPERVTVKGSHGLGDATEAAKAQFRRRHQLAPQVELLCVPVEQLADTEDPRARRRGRHQDPPDLLEEALDRAFGSFLSRALAANSLRPVLVRVVQVFYVGDTLTRQRYLEPVEASEAWLANWRRELQPICAEVPPAPGQLAFDALLEDADSPGLMEAVRKCRYDYWLEVQREGNWELVGVFYSTRTDYPVGHSNHQSATVTA